MAGIVSLRESQLSSVLNLTITKHHDMCNCKLPYSKEDAHGLAQDQIPQKSSHISSVYPQYKK